MTSTGGHVGLGIHPIPARERAGEPGPTVGKWVARFLGYPLDRGTGSRRDPLERPKSLFSGRGGHENERIELPQTEGRAHLAQEPLFDPMAG